jgi:hypothetical protein
MMLMMMTPKHLLPWFLAASGSLLLGLSQPEHTLDPEKEIMWRKLDLAHDALDALALDDFEALEAYAVDLAALSESGEWLETSDDQYRKESALFRKSARELGEAARARDTNAAALAYVDLTLRCIRCHRLLGSVPRR